MDKYMEIAKLNAEKGMKKQEGGPFGAVITDSDGNVIAVSSNTVLGSHDPTAHAEINAIRKACRILKTHDLSGYILYATGYPCPMCLSAIMWANIKKVYYGTNLKDAEDIGFRDDFIYNYIKGNSDNKTLELINIDRDQCLELFNEYKEKNKEIY